MNRITFRGEREISWFQRGSVIPGDKTRHPGVDVTQLPLFNRKKSFWKSLLKCIYEFPINFGFAEKNLQVTRIVYNVYVYRGLSVAFFFFEFRYVNLIVKKRKNHAIHIYMYIYSSISEIVSLPTLIHFLADEIN